MVKIHNQRGDAQPVIRVIACVLHDLRGSASRCAPWLILRRARLRRKKRHAISESHARSKRFRDFLIFKDQIHRLLRARLL